MNNSENRVAEPAPADQDWFGGRRWTGIAALGVVIVVLACIVVVVITRSHHTSSATLPANGTTSTPVAPSGSLPTTVPTSAPAGVTWSIYETYALPSLPGAGPSHVDGAIATGYSHTPLGALLADVNEGFRYGLASDSQWRAAALAMLASGPGRDAWVRIRAKNLYGPGGARGDGTPFAQIAGFQFVSYTSTDAVIQIVTRTSSNALQVATDHVTWDGQDWRYVTAPDGGNAANVSRVDSLAGFIEWRGV